MVYIYNKETKQLTVMQLGMGMVTDEEQVRHVATEDGMEWEDVSWGYVDNLQMDLSDS